MQWFSRSTYKVPQIQPQVCFAPMIPRFHPRAPTLSQLVHEIMESEWVFHLESNRWFRSIHDHTGESLRLSDSPRESCFSRLLNNTQVSPVGSGILRWATSSSHRRRSGGQVSSFLTFELRVSSAMRLMKLFQASFRAETEPLALK